MAGSRCTKRTLVCFVLLVVVWVFFSAVLATAQGPPFPVTSPSAITNQYKQAQNAWFNNIGIYAKRLFFLLAAIEVIWSLTLLVLERSDFQALAATLVRKIMWIGIFYAFLINAGTWIPAIINSFMAVGEIGGNVGPVSPSVVLGTGLQVASSLFAGASNAGFLTNPGPAFALVFAALITFLAYVGIAIQYVVACVESYIVIGAGVIFLGFGGSRWTMPYVERYVGLAVSVGIKLMTLILLIGLGLQLATAPGTGWVAEAQSIGNSPDPAMTSFDVMAASLIFLAVCWMAPKLVSALIGGSPAFTGGDVLSPSMTVAGAGMTGAAWALAGAGAAYTAGKAVRDWAGSGFTKMLGSGTGGGGAAPSAPSSAAPLGATIARGSTFSATNALTFQPPPPKTPTSSGGEGGGGQVSPPGSTQTFGQRGASALRSLRTALNNVRLPQDGHHHGPPPGFGGGHGGGEDV
jgi:type IV secretion system protein TrbL